MKAVFYKLHWRESAWSLPREEFTLTCVTSGTVLRREACFCWRNLCHPRKKQFSTDLAHRCAIRFAMPYSACSRTWQLRGIQVTPDKHFNLSWFYGIIDTSPPPSLHKCKGRALSSESFKQSEHVWVGFRELHESSPFNLNPAKLAGNVSSHQSRANIHNSAIFH